MRLIVLGSGTCVPSLIRSGPAYFLAAGGRRMLIDISSTTLQQLIKAQISFLEIDAIFITHTHPDHVSGLLPFMHASTSMPGFRRTKELSIIGPDNMPVFYENCIGSIMKPPNTFSVAVTAMVDHLATGPLLIESTSTAHTATSIAYRFTENNRSVVFTGDCDYEDSLIDFCEGADLLVIDCSFPNHMKTAGHLIPKECGVIAREAGVKKVLLSHVYPTDGPDTLLIDECRSVFDGVVMLAHDLMKFDIS